MTVDDFMNRFDIKRRSRVMSWYDSNYIPGAYKNELGEIVIPEEAIPPFTGARAKQGDAVYLSLLRGVCKRRHVLPQIYNMSKNEFDFYINTLVRAGLIIVDVINDIEYYRPTLLAEEYVKENIGIRGLLRKIQPLTETIVSGTAKAIMDYNETH